MDPAPSLPHLPHYVVRLSGVLAALLGRAESAQINDGAEISEDELVDGLRAAGLITHPSPRIAQHRSPAAQAVSSAAQPPAAATAAAADAEGARDDGLRAAGMVTHPSPFTAQLHTAPAAHATTTAAAHPPAAATAAAADEEGVPARRIVRLASAIAALLVVHAEGAEVTEDEAGRLSRARSRPTLNLLLVHEEEKRSFPRERPGTKISPWPSWVSYSSSARLYAHTTPRLHALISIRVLALTDPAARC
jgi:hypothetical protein